VQQIEPVVGGGHASGTLGTLHVGLGDAAKARLRVRWPGNRWGSDEGVGPWFEVDADRMVIVDREKGLVPWPHP
jgi:hypothetical protein